MGGSGEDPLDSYNNCQNMRIDMADFRGDKIYLHYNFFMVRNAASKYTSYRLRATAELPETTYSMAVEETTSMEWHSLHLTDLETMTWLMLAGREDGRWYKVCHSHK